MQSTSTLTETTREEHFRRLQCDEAKGEVTFTQVMSHGSPGHWFRMHLAGMEKRSVFVQAADATPETSERIMEVLAMESAYIRSLLTRFEELDLRIAMKGFTPREEERRLGIKNSGQPEALLHLRTTQELTEEHVGDQPEKEHVLQEILHALSSKEIA